MRVRVSRIDYSGLCSVVTVRRSRPHREEYCHGR